MKRAAAAGNKVRQREYRSDTGMAIDYDNLFMIPRKSSSCCPSRPRNSPAGLRPRPRFPVPIEDHFDLVWIGSAVSGVPKRRRV